MADQQAAEALQALGEEGVVEDASDTEGTVSGKACDVVSESGSGVNSEASHESQASAQDEKESNYEEVRSVHSADNFRAGNKGCAGCDYRIYGRGQFAPSQKAHMGFGGCLSKEDEDTDSEEDRSADRGFASTSSASKEESVLPNYAGTVAPSQFVYSTPPPSKRRRHS